MIRIKQEAGAYCPRLYDAEGKDLTSVLAINYGATVTIDQGMNTLRAELIMVELQKIDCAHAIWETKHPVTGSLAPVAAIEFRDGSRVEFTEDGSPKIIAGKGA